MKDKANSLGGRNAPEGNQSLRREVLLNLLHTSVLMRSEWNVTEAREDKRTTDNNLFFFFFPPKAMSQATNPIPRSQLLFSIFRDPEYLAAFPLTNDNVLEYFSTSPFFDRSSNNEILRMQRIAAPPNEAQAGQRETENQLK